MHKRILALTLALALLAGLTACGKQETAAPTKAQTQAPQTTAAREAEGDVASPQTTKVADAPIDAQTDAPTTAAPVETQPADSRTGMLFQKYVRDKVADGTYTLRTEQAGMKVVISADGGDSAIESDAAGLLRFSLVHKGSEYFMIMHTTKKYTTMSEAEYKQQVDNVGSTGVDLDGMRFRESGSESLDGKRYSTETYDEGEQGVVTYFFDETGVRRTRIVKDGKTSLTDVFTVSADADTSAFEIPVGYTLVAEPSQLLT